MEKRRSDFFLFFVLTGLAITLGLFGFSSLNDKKEKVSVPVFATTPLKVSAEEPEKETVVDVVSPDGKFILKMKNGKEVEKTVTQTFYIIQGEAAPIEVFSRKSPSGNLALVPYNTFSPNNKYFFLVYEEEGEKRYIVLKTDGKDIQKDKKYVEISELFNEKYPEFTITDVTGWGGYSVVIVNTDKDGKTGPSWWFDLTNFSFYRLSTRFN